MRILIPLVCVLAAQAGTPLRSGGKPVRWKDGQITLKISRTVHLAEGEGGVDRQDSAASVHTALLDAVRQWNRAGRGAVHITVEFTDEGRIRPGESVVTFTDPAPFDSGQCNAEQYIACTILVFSRETGEIESAWIAFNPYKRHSSIGLKERHDIGLVMLHELGHALGLDHSGLVDSVMAAAVELDGGAAAVFPLRQLAPDDVLTLGELYRPELDGSKIRGMVMRGGTGVGGAHVIAMDEQGRPVHATLSQADGSYSLAVAPGTYLVAVEPLDGPALASQVISQPAETLPFPTMFWSRDGAELVVVEPGQTRTGIDFELRAGPVVNVDTIGIVDNGRYLGAPRVFLARGREYLLGMTRSPAEGTPAVRVLTPGITGEGEANSPASAPQLVRQRLRIAEQAEAGAYTVLYSSEGGSALLPGALRIVPNPVIEAIQQAGSGRISIRGKELAAGSHRAEEPADGGAWPSQLGGVAVRIGERWTPLISVAPEEIVAEIPTGLNAESVEVAVTGGVESASVIVRLAVQ